MSERFSAAPQTLGYLYQIRGALWLLLQRDDEKTAISIESLDDIAFYKHGTVQELLQLKHHTKQASLTDASTELWRTLRIWSEAVRQRTVVIAECVLSFVTTATAPDGSVAALLRQDRTRDPGVACQRLIGIAGQSGNQELKTSFAAFLSLSLQERRELVGAIHIIDGSADILGVVNDIKTKIKYSVRPEHLEGLYERLEGWWLGKAIVHLRTESAQPITGFEVHDKIVELAEQFRADSLPIDFLNVEPPAPPDAEGDNRIFVQQLREIGIGTKRIEKAVLDYYRAFEQRSRWAREDLLIGDELCQYENRLVDEWERYALAVHDQHSLEQAEEIELQEIGRIIYNWMEFTADCRIRPRVSAHYVTRGSYHMLADEKPPRVWWHPEFAKRLNELLAPL